MINLGTVVDLTYAIRQLQMLSIAPNVYQSVAENIPRQIYHVLMLEQSLLKYPDVFGNDSAFVFDLALMQRNVLKVESH